jgi:hypothetical protein
LLRDAGNKEGYMLLNKCLIAVSILALTAASPHVASAKSVKNLVTESNLAEFCSKVGIGSERTVTVTMPDGLTVTGTIECESEDVGFTGTDSSDDSEADDEGDRVDDHDGGDDSDDDTEDADDDSDSDDAGDDDADDYDDESDDSHDDETDHNSGDDDGDGDEEDDEGNHD